MPDATPINALPAIEKLIRFVAAALCVAVLVAPVAVFAQSPGDRSSADARPQKPAIATRMHDVISEVRITNAPARDVLKWWSQVTEVPLVINWNKLENEGINPNKEITLHMDLLPVHQVLELVLGELSNEITPVTYETTQWYVKVVTQEEADRNVVRRVYPVGDLIFDVPDFTNAPRMGLADALEGSSTQGSSTSIFDNDDEGDDRDDRETKGDRGEALAQLIRDTITPHLWRANGGEHATVRYMRGMLIVVAPVYVQQQIGPSFGFNARPPKAAKQSSSAGAPAQSGKGVASVQKHQGSATSAVGK